DTRFPYTTLFRSHALASRTVAYNDLAERVTLQHQDLRDWPGGAFDLVTASPPYIPVGQGVQPQHPQKAAARFELHGDIFDYCQAAARSLAAQGLFCFCLRLTMPDPSTLSARPASRSCAARKCTSGPA